MDDYSKFLSEISNLVKSLRESSWNAEKDIPETDKGVTLLQVKIHSLLSYLTNLAFVLLLKVEGKKLELAPVVAQLAELRVVIEKTRPLELKLKYQIDKLVKAAAIADDKSFVRGQDEDDELMFAPNPSALVKKEEDAEKVVEVKDDDVYRPPRIAPQHFEPTRDKTRLSKRQQKIASQSRLLADLKTQYSMLPEEHSSHGTGYGTKDMTNKFDRELAEKEAFEEEYFLRPNLTKAEKSLRKKMNKQGALVRFQDEFKELNQDYNDIEGIERALLHQEVEEKGTGLLSKTKKTKETLKRKRFETAADMLASVGEKHKAADLFKRKAKIMKRASLLAERKRANKE